MPHKGFPTWHSSSLSYTPCAHSEFYQTLCLPFRQGWHSSGLQGGRVITSRGITVGSLLAPGVFFTAIITLRPLCNIQNLLSVLPLLRIIKKPVQSALILILWSFLTRNCSWNLPRVCICYYLHTTSNIKISHISAFKKQTWTAFPSHIITLALQSVFPFQFLAIFLIKPK